jgi:glycosyltransferase involved in cell wall biosynthesis
MQTCLPKPTSTPYRIAILGSRGIPARYGGFETFAEQLALGLVQAGVEVTVFAEGDSSADSAAFDYQGIRVEPVRTHRLGPATTIVYDTMCLWRARRGFDVVYMLGYGAAFACWLPRCWGTQVWVNMDGLEWARSKWRPVARGYLRAMEACMARVATRVLADAQAIQRYYQQRYPKGAPSTFIPYGAHLPAVNAQDDLSAQLQAWQLIPDGYLLIVARMEPENHILEMLQAYSAVAASVSMPLIVVGEHRAENAYCARLRDFTHQEGIRFIGPVYDAAALTALRRGAWAYLHGHSVGGTNPSLLEAMACANFVIAHDNPFNREVLGEHALYFSTPSDLSTLLQGFSSLNHTRSRHQQAVSNRVQTAYSWSSVIGAYLALMAQDVPHRKEGA